MTERKIHKIDASGKAAGRLASQIATILRGKHKPEYEPNLDMGDVVEVENADKMKFTGNKIEQKEYYRHSGYPGGLKKEKLREVYEKDPAEVLKRTVRGMLPDNKLRQNMMKRLKIK